jgi:hypothetical protein
MIWFTCHKCGKTLGRPETSAGAFVFCDCGQGLTVPWDSTVEAPPQAPTVAAPPLPPMVPVPVGEEKIPVARRPAQADAPPPPTAARPPEIDLDVRRREPTVRSRACCFNHQDRPVVLKCADCDEGFCTDCLVQFKGKTLCGPCKNFRLREPVRSGTLSGKALTGVILALCSAPLVMCVWPFGATSFVVLLCVLGLLAQMAAAALGVLALRETELNPKLAGRPLAITTVVTAGLATVLTVFFVLFGPRAL